MTIRVYYDRDTDPKAIQKETIAVLGYGIQGRAQALNLRDSGLDVVIGNRHDVYAERAREEGFRVLDLPEAVASASLILFLLPDEVQPGVYQTAVSPYLQSGDGLVLAHGYSLHYGLIHVASDVDVLLLAPRMPGQYLRSRYLEGWGVPAFVSVEQEATGKGRQRLLALASALGVTRCAAIEVSAAVETELDHFSEHFLYPLFFRTLEMAFDTLVASG
ncbi:NAD(P)-binding domain-containing protein, partial [Acidobacteria bacterium AH-259-D05]|nr:NAD(P)-binding domain-containing protein [Acidobacteria bacterium AH-259-D05]